MNTHTGIQTVGIIGTGLMGRGIAEAAALAGISTVLVKATTGTPDAARRDIEKSLATAVAKARITPEQRERAWELLHITNDRLALAKVDLLLESVIEDLPTKRALFTELTPLVTPHAIFASNTSTLHISDIARGCGREDRTIGMHFFSPAPAMKLVELASIATTCNTVMKTATEFVQKLGKTPIPVSDSTGFIVNRLLLPYLIGAVSAYEQGLARAEAIDLAMRLGCGYPIGPLALCDLIGIDVVYAMAKLLYAEFHELRYKPSALLRRMIQTGQLGKKTCLGFYDYSTQPPQTNQDLWTLVRNHTRTPVEAEEYEEDFSYAS